MLILEAGIAVLKKGLTLTQPKYEIHAQHRAGVVDRRTGHDDRNGRSRSRNQRSRSTGITGHVAPEYPPGYHEHGFHELDELARRMGVHTTVHGHQHDCIDSTARWAEQGFESYGVGLRGVMVFDMLHRQTPGEP